MKITCEIDWVEDGNLDKGIQQVIIDRVVEVVVAKSMEKFSREVSDKLATRADEMISGILEKFMTREIVVTDNWGSVQDTFESVDELLKSKFDEFMTVRVSSNGTTMKGTSCGGVSRVEYLLDNKIRNARDAIQNQVVQEADKMIRSLKEAAAKEAALQIVEKLELGK